MQLRHSQRNILLIVHLLVLLTISSSIAQASFPPFPDFMLLNGTLKIDGEPAPVGTIIEAFVQDDDTPGVKDGNNTLSTEGVYGELWIEDRNESDVGRTVLFFADGYQTDQSTTFAFTTQIDTPDELDLTVTLAPSQVNLIEPQNNSIIENPQTFSWTESTDENEDEITYVLNAWSDETPTGLQVETNDTNYTLESSSGLEDGTYFWTVTATDGHSEIVSDTFTFLLNDEGPTFHSISFHSFPKINENLSLTVRVNDTNGIQNLTFSWNATGTMQEVSTVDLGGILEIEQLFESTVTQPQSTIITIQFDATDIYGQTSQFTEGIFVQNTVPETPTIQSPTDGVITSTQPLPVEVITQPDADGDELTINYFLNGELVDESQENVSLSVADGQYTLDVNVVDEAGDVSENASITLTIDTTDPSVSVTNPQGGESFQGNEEVQITWNVSDENLIDQPITLEYFNGSDWNIIASGQENTGSHDWTTPLLESTDVKIKITAVDAASNIANHTTESFIVDSVSPVVELTNPVEGQIIRGGSTIEVTWEASDLSLPENPITLEYFDGEEWVALVENDTNDESFDWTLEDDDVLDVSLLLTVRDSAGNVATHQIDDITIDATSPSITDVTSDKQHYMQNETVTVTVTAQDSASDPIVIVDFSELDESQDNVSTTDNDDGTFTATHEINSSVADGEYRIIATVADEVENQGVVGHVVISEIMLAPDGSNTNRQWIELYNPTSEEVNVTGWGLRSKNGGTKNIDSETIIQPYSTIIITNNAQDFEDEYEFSPDVDEDDLSSPLNTMTVNGSGDFFQLKDAENNIVDVISWANHEDYGWSLFIDEDSGNSITRNPVMQDTDSENDFESNVEATPQSPTSPNFVQITVDNTEPVIDSVSLDENEVIAGGEKQVTVQVTDEVSGVLETRYGVLEESSEIEYDSLSIFTNETDDGYIETIDFSSLEDGSYVFVVAAQDNAGNIVFDQTTILIDTQNPFIVSFQPDLNEFTNTTTPSIIVVLNDSTSGINTQEVYLTYLVDQEQVGPINLEPTQNEDGSATATQLVAAPSSSEISATINATDNAGNAVTFLWSFTIDSQEPSVSSLQTDDPENVVTSSQQINLSVTVTDDASGVASVLAKSNHTLSLSKQDGTDIYSVITTLSDFGCSEEGTCQISLTATDNNGHVNDDESITLTIDETNPVIDAIDLNTTDTVYDENFTIDVTVTDNNTQNANVTVSGESSVSLNKIEDTKWQVETTPKDLGCITNGQCDLVITVIDDAGNQQTNETNISVTYGPQAPVLQTIPDVQFLEDTTNDSINLDSYVTDDDNALDELVWQVQSLSSENVTIDIQEDRTLSVSADEHWHGVATLVLNVTDDNTTVSSNDILITVISVNDAPSTPIPVSPEDGEAFNTNSVTLSWNESTDVDEGDVITYYVYHGNETERSLLTTTQDTSFEVTDLEFEKTFTWQVYANDSQDASAFSDVMSYSTTENFQPEITEHNPESLNQTIMEKDTLDFNVTVTDGDGHAINVTWYVDEELVASETTEFSYETDLESAGEHSVKVVATDELNASSQVEWTVTIENYNQAPVLEVPSDVQTVVQDQTLEFNVTATDADNHTLSYTLNMSQVTLTQNGNNAAIAWTPSSSDIGTHTLLVNVTDEEGLSDAKTVTINVVETNLAPTITSISPEGDTTIAESTGSVEFSVEVEDPNQDAFTTQWFVNGTQVATDVTSYTLDNKDKGIYNVTFTASDSELSSSQMWIITVSDTPFSNTYDSNLFDLSQDQLSTATDIVITKTDVGSIDFGNQEIDFSGVLDIDEIINISDGVAAIDTDTAPTLNAPASIKFLGLSFAKAPFLNRADGFGASGSTPCSDDVCTNKEFDSSTGTYTFDVTGFSTYFVAQNTTNDVPVITSSPITSTFLNREYTYVVEVQDLDDTSFEFTLLESPDGMTISSSGVISWLPTAMGTETVTVQVSDGDATDTQTYELDVVEGPRLFISDFDVEIDGKDSNNVRNNSLIRREAKPGSTVEFTIEVSNGFTKAEDVDIEDVEIEIIIEDLDDGDDLEEDLDSEDIDAGKDEEFSFEFEVPLDTEEDKYDVEIIVEGEDTNDTIHRFEWFLQLEVEQEKHEIIVDNPHVFPSELSCRRSVEVSVDVQNIGEKDEDEVSVTFVNDLLEINEKLEEFSIESTESFTAKKRISLPEDIQPGEYDIDIIAQIEDENEEVETSTSFTVHGCEDEEEKSEDKNNPVKTQTPKSSPSDNVDLIIGSGGSQTFVPSPTPTPKVSSKPFEQTLGYTTLLIVSVVLLFIIFIAIVVAIALTPRRRRRKRRRRRRGGRPPVPPRPDIMYKNF